MLAAFDAEERFKNNNVVGGPGCRSVNPNPGCVVSDEIWVVLAVIGLYGDGVVSRTDQGCGWWIREKNYLGGYDCKGYCPGENNHIIIQMNFSNVTIIIFELQICGVISFIHIFLC